MFDGLCLVVPCDGIFRNSRYWTSLSHSPLGIVVAVQSVSHVWLFAAPWTAACQASLSLTVSQNLLKFMSIESVMPSNHLILCCPLLLLPSVFNSIRVFSNESTVHIRWPKYWNFSFSTSPSDEYSGLSSLGLTGFVRRVYAPRFFVPSQQKCGVTDMKAPSVGHSSQRTDRVIPLK